MTPPDYFLAIEYTIELCELDIMGKKNSTMYEIIKEKLDVIRPLLSESEQENLKQIGVTLRTNTIGK